MENYSMSGFPDVLQKWTLGQEECHSVRQLKNQTSRNEEFYFGGSNRSCWGQQLETKDNLMMMTDLQYSEAVLQQQ